MIEAAKIWNEPNNKSHWDLQLDPDWARFAETAIAAGKAIRSAHPTLPRVLGGISPIDPAFINNMKARGVLDHVDAVAVHGFPLDWNLWKIDEWPAKLAEIQALVSVPVWVTEVGVSSFGADEVQAWGLKRTAELLTGRAPRIHWYSLYDLPMAWEATTGTRRPKAPPTTAISIWDCCARTVRRRLQPSCFRNSRLQWASASGSTSRTTGSTRP